MANDQNLEEDDLSLPRSRSLWNDNHGNLLLAVAGAVFAIGALVILYQQYLESTRPVRFPDGRSIETVEGTSQESEIKNGFTITVSGAANDTGAMMIAVYDAAVDFNKPAEAALSKNQSIRDGDATWVIPLDSLPEKFAVAAYHDENEDGSLDRHVTGIPTERYGFSNNARGMFGPPSFDDAVIERPETPAKITVVIR